MSLNYTFPIIRTLDDVLPYIDDNFRVVEKDGWTFINYNMMGLDVFPEMVSNPTTQIEIDHNHYAAVRRECRGIIFDTASREIVSRPFHKFFNAGERASVALDKIDVSLPHVVLEKLDGSMIRPLYVGGGFRWGTKMGITDVGMKAEEFVARRLGQGDASYLGVADYCRINGLTSLFEFCSRSTRIVVDYPVDRMVLLAIRENVSGKYLSRDELQFIAAAFDVPLVDNLDFLGRTFSAPAPVGVADMDKFMDVVKDRTEGEGKIVLFDNGHAVKVKSDWYVRIHRAKDMMRSEMRLLDLVFNQELDDLLSALPEEDCARIDKYLKSYLVEWEHLRDVIDYRYDNVREVFKTKKDFALSDTAAGLSQTFKGIMFGMWDGKYETASEAATTIVRNSMTSESKFAAMKVAINFDTGWDEIWAAETEEAA
jgi:RNA ligase